VFSSAPGAGGETIVFRDERLDHLTDNKEIDFVLSPFPLRQVPLSRKMKSAGLSRKAQAASSAISGCKIAHDRLKVHSIVIQVGALGLDVDGDLSMD